MNDEQWEGFLRMRCNLQQTQYRQNYRHASFEIILANDVPAGRFYVDRGEKEFRIIDISILPAFRGFGIAGRLIEALLREASDKQLPATLHVDKQNQAFWLYRRLGFRIKEDRGVSWFMIHHWIDDRIL